MLLTRIKIFFFAPNQTDRGGFTLVEIIVVIGVLGLIMGAIYPFLNTINRWGGVSQNNMQQFEDSVNNYFLAISKKIRNANAIDIYASDGSTSNQGNKLKIKLDSGEVTYQISKNLNNISIEEVMNTTTKKIVPSITNITID